MQTSWRRRFYDGVLFILLIITLGGFALVLHIHPSHLSSSNTSDGSVNLILQAQAWLHGHLDIGMPVHDSITLNGKIYIIYPPLPSLLMVPLVAVLGDKFSDIWFTWIFAALNIILLFRTLEVMRVRHITHRTSLENLLMALTFGFGTIALWLSLGGKVWFTAQIIDILGIMIILHSTLSRRWSLATLGVGIVMLTRTSDVLVGLIPLVVYLHDLGVGRRNQNQWHFLPQRWPSLRELALILTPFMVALLIFLVHNKLYFGNPLSSGYDIQNQQNYPAIKYGVISWHYIWPNFVIDFLRWPGFSFTGPFDVHPHLDLFIDGIGTSMFFSTPLLAIFFFAPQGKTPQSWLRSTLWVTVGLMLLAVLTFCAAGWSQVGARYLLSLYPLLFLLLAQRAARLDIRWISLAGLSIFINLLLARTFWAGEPSTLFIAGSAGVVAVACLIALILLHREKQQQGEDESPASAMTSVGSTSKNEAGVEQAVCD